MTAEAVRAVHDELCGPNGDDESTSRGLLEYLYLFTVIGLIGLIAIGVALILVLE
jgi:hypothetical protein